MPERNAQAGEWKNHPVGYRAPNALPYWSLVPLVAIIAEVMGAGVTSKGVTARTIGCWAIWGMSCLC